MSRIHATALVDPKAELAADVEVGAYSIVGPHVRVGAGTVIGPHVVLTGRTRLGERNRLFQFTSIGEIPQDRKYGGEPTTTTIGDDNVFREFMTINAGTAQDRGDTRIGNGNLFLAYTHVAHDCVVGNWHDVLEQRAARGSRPDRRLGRDGRLFRRAPVLPGRRACDDRRGRDRAAGRAAVRHGRRLPGDAARHQHRRPAPARLHGGRTSSRCAAPTRRSIARDARSTTPGRRWPQPPARRLR